MTATKSTPSDASQAAAQSLGPRAHRAGRGGDTITVGIVGATGYAGGELVRLLLAHTNVRLAGLHGRNRDNQPIEAAHPHLSQDGTIAVVHNGIIENHQALREFLKSKGHKFTSETDTAFRYC